MDSQDLNKIWLDAINAMEDKENCVKAPQNALEAYCSSRMGYKLVSYFNNGLYFKVKREVMVL